MIDVGRTAAGGESIWFSCNQQERGTGKETVVLFMPHQTPGFGTIYIFSNYLDVAHFSGNDTYVATIPWDDGVYRNFRVEKHDDILETFVNGAGVYRGRLKLNNLPGSFSLHKGSNAETEYILRNFKIYGGKHRQYAPVLTEQDMWGLFTNGDYATKEPNGGNGVNHPSSVGINQVYIPALQEFVQDLSKFRMPSVFEQQLMPMVQTPSWQIGGTATTTSGANLRFANVAKTSYPKVVTLQKTDGTYLKFRTDINSFSAAVGLLADDFGTYRSSDVTQLVYPFSGTADASKFTSYRGILM